MKTGYRSEYEKALYNELHSQKQTFIPTLELKKGFNIKGNSIKNFDFLLVSGGLFALDVKGKQFGFLNKKTGRLFNRYDTYVQVDECQHLKDWSEAFKEVGVSLTPLFVFMFKIMEEEDLAAFVDVLEVKGTQYGVLACEPSVYWAHKKPKVRSEKYGVITVSRKLFPEIAKPLSYFIPGLNF